MAYFVLVCRHAVKECAKTAKLELVQQRTPFFPLYGNNQSTPPSFPRANTSGNPYSGAPSISSSMSFYVNSRTLPKDVSGQSPGRPLITRPMDCVSKLLLMCTTMFTLGRAYLRAGNILGEKVCIVCVCVYVCMYVQTSCLCVQAHGALMITTHQNGLPCTGCMICARSEVRLRYLAHQLFSLAH
jgi:hypothetical protein